MSSENPKSRFIVTKAAERPASEAHGLTGMCFYCQQPVGEPHLAACVLVSKWVKCKATITYLAKVPADWDKGMVDFHHDGSSWCHENIIQELVRFRDWKDAHKKGCMCEDVEIEYVEEFGIPWLDEDGQGYLSVPHDKDDD